MPTRTIRRTVLAAVLSGLIASSMLPRGAAAADMVAVHRIDAKIVAAQHHLARWQRSLARWQTRVAKMEARVQRISYASSHRARPPAPDVLTRGAVPYLTRGTGVAEVHRRLQALLRDHRAQEALQQSAAWSAYLSQLASARLAALARPVHRAVATPAGPPTYGAWAHSFLRAVAAPRCTENLILVVSWETQESTAALFNPLATSHEMPGDSVFNGAGVKNYRSFVQGVRAAAATLVTGASSYGYQAVIDALRSCAGADEVAATIRDSAWCRGCTGGSYLVGLVPVVRSSYADHAARLISVPA
jgi:hypothetical protein